MNLQGDTIQSSTPSDGSPFYVSQEKGSQYVYSVPVMCSPVFTITITFAQALIISSGPLICSLPMILTPFYL